MGGSIVSNFLLGGSLYPTEQDNRKQEGRLPFLRHQRVAMEAFGMECGHRRKGKGNFMEDKRRLERSDCLGKANMSTPHDKGYKKSLSRPGEFLHFLKKYVGADWMMEIRETDLSLCDKEMLERDYDGKEADLIYKVKLPGGREAFVFILQ